MCFLIDWALRNSLTTSSMESLAQLEALCERLYNSQDSAERAHAENTLKCFSVNSSYISQCQYILDNASTPYALMLASSSLLKQVTEQRLSLQIRLDIRNVSVWLQSFMPVFLELFLLSLSPLPLYFFFSFPFVYIICNLPLCCFGMLSSFLIKLEYMKVK